MEKINQAPKNLEWLTVKKDKRIKLLRADDVYWIEAQGNYISLKFADGAEILRETMEKLEAQLDLLMAAKRNMSFFAIVQLYF